MGTTLKHHIILATSCLDSLQYKYTTPSNPRHCCLTVESYN